MTGFSSALVTGSTGFIGSALTRRLSKDGIKVYCLVRNNGRDRTHLKALPGVELIEIQSSHVSKLQDALSGISADVVFNLASYGVNQKDSEPEAMLDGNVNFIARLLLATAKWPLKQFIHAGSCSEYGPPLINEPLNENYPIRPLSLYGAAKAASVLYGTALAARLNIPLVTLRLFGVYGIGEGPDRLIPYIIDRLKRYEPVDLTPGEQVRDFTYIEDVVEAFVMAGRCQCLEPLQVYNICSGVPVRVRDVGENVAMFMDKAKELLKWGERAYRQDEPMWMVGNNRKFVEATYWRPKVSLLEGVKLMINVAVK